MAALHYFDNAEIKDRAENHPVDRLAQGAGRLLGRSQAFS
jgi:hypothetical protein